MKTSLFAGIAAAFLASAPAFAAPLTLEETLGTFNLVTESYTGNQEVEGRTYVDSSISNVNGQFGFVTPTDSESYAALTVNGDIVNSNINLTTTTQAVVSGSVVNSNINNGTAVTGATDLPSFDFDVFRAESLSLRDLDTTTQADISDQNKKVFGGSSVVNVSLSDLSSGGYTFDFSHGGPIIINVSGTSGSFGMNGLGLSEADASRVIWNFYEAETISVNSSIFGHVLATEAVMTGFNGSTEGTVIAKSVTLTNGELHQVAWNDTLPGGSNTPVVPLPAGGVLLITGLGAMTVMRRRRR